MESSSPSGSTSAPGRKCQQCGWVFSKPSKLENHLAKTVAHSKDNFPCPMCDKEFQRSSDLNRHLGLTHRMTIQDYKSKGGVQNRDIRRRETPTREPIRRSRPVDYATAFVMKQRQIWQKVIAKKTRKLTKLLMKHRPGKKTRALENLKDELVIAHKLVSHFNEFFERQR